MLNNGLKHKLVIRTDNVNLEMGEKMENGSSENQQSISIITLPNRSVESIISEDSEEK